MILHDHISDCDRVVEFDTSEAVNIEFQVTALTLMDSGGTDVSPTIKIIINTVEIIIPDLIVGSLPSPQEIKVNSAGIYQFDDPFSTSLQNYIIYNHDLRSTSETLTLVKDPATGQFSVTIDTTSVRTVTFSVYGEI